MRSDEVAISVEQRQGGGALLRIRSWGKDPWEGSDIRLVLTPDLRDYLVTELNGTE